MTTEQLEQRLTKLEAEMSSLRAHVLGSQGQKDWRRAIEAFAGDDDLQQIFAGAMKICEADRKKARQRRNVRRRSKK
jgi:hypothetical protein